MDGSGDGDGPVTVPAASGGEIRRSARRRLVQATLFQHKPPEPERKSEDGECAGDGEKGSGRGEEDEDEDEGMCGSQSKKRRGRKGKPTPPKKVQEKSPLKRTPKKRNPSGCDGQGAVDLLEIEESTPPPIPNLRLEAKLTAEENSRRFSGRQIHPFFSALKANKRSRETTELQNGCCSVLGVDKTVTVGPVHVFEREQDDEMTLDWKDWLFVEERSVHGCSVEAGHVFSSFGGSIGDIGFGRAFGATCTSDESLAEVAASYPPIPRKLLHEASIIVSELPGEIPGAGHQHAAEADLEIIEVNLPYGAAGKSGVKQQGECFQERNMSHHAACSNQPDKILWTDKYQPRKAMDVCGNYESVKFLDEWLQDWRKRGHRSSIDLSGGDECEMQDADYNAFQSDCDSEDIDEETSCKNVLLVTGPAGCGKSAAIYACAKEQGFKILEISASETRSSLIVKQKFGEALESHSLEWTQESLTGPECKDILKFPKVLSHSKVTKELDEEVMELIHIPDDDGLLGAHMTAGKFFSNDSSSEPIHNQLKPIVLFEDVDIVFPEDRGLTAAIQQIAEKAKGPVILTSNCVQPVLPDNLQRLQVCFSMPSKEELLQHLHLVCTSENAKIQPVFLEQLIHNCQSDIRKTIMHLQFWCQGNQSERASKVPKLPAPVLFDPETGHKILPKLMPWNIPSPLSELVEKEISASLAKLEDVSVSMDFSKQETENNEMDIPEKDSIEAKKESMLSMNCSEEEYNDFLTPSTSNSGYFSPSRTPDLSSVRKTRRKLVVMSSDSEDEYLPDSFPSILETDNHSLPLEVDCKVPLDYQGVHEDLKPLTTMLPCFGSFFSKEDASECSETATELSLKDASRLANVSFVAESSFVPETEINDAGAGSHSRMSFDEVTDDLEDVSICHNFGQELLPPGGDKLCEATLMLKKDSDLLGTGFDLFAAASEEVEDSQSQHVQAVTREFQLTDQCSRMDFNVKPVQVEEPSAPLFSHSVQESWTNLRDNHADLKDIVASELKDAPGIVELACHFSNLISETELLLSKCQLLDFGNSSTIVSDESEAFGQSNDGLMMTSVIGQHGLCFYANKVASVGLKLSSVDEVAAASFNHVMSCTNKIMEVGGFFERNAFSGSIYGVREEEHMTQSRSGPILSRVPKSRLIYIVQSLVPSRMLMTLRGDTIHEFTSSLSCISRSEASRLSGSTGRTKRRGRTPRNYLSTGSLMLSPEEISFLCRCNLYGRSSFKEGDIDNR